MEIKNCNLELSKYPNKDSKLMNKGSRMYIVLNDNVSIYITYYQNLSLVINIITSFKAFEITRPRYLYTFNANRDIQSVQSQAVHVVINIIVTLCTKKTK